MKNLIKVVTIGISDEYLTEIVAWNQANNLLHPAAIKLIKDVIKQ